LPGLTPRNFTQQSLKVRSGTPIVAQSSDMLGCLPESIRNAFSNRVMM
jgi:hypothetical protein